MAFLKKPKFTRVFSKLDKRLFIFCLFAYRRGGIPVNYCPGEFTYVIKFLSRLVFVNIVQMRFISEKEILIEMICP